MTINIVEMLVGDSGEVSARRVGYLLCILTLCFVDILLCSFIGYVVFCNPANGVFTLPQLVTLFISTSGILSGAVTAGFIMKKSDGESIDNNPQEQSIAPDTATSTNRELPE